MYRNYGDYNFFENGCLVDDGHSDTEFDLLRCMPYPDEEGKYMFAHLHVNIDNEWIDRETVMEYAGMTEESFDPVQYAIACTDYYSWENFGAADYGVMYDFLDCSFGQIIEELNGYQIAHDEVVTGSYQRGDVGTVYYDADENYVHVIRGDGEKMPYFKSEEEFEKHPDRVCYVAADDNKPYTREDLAEIAGSEEYTNELFVRLDGRDPEDVFKDEVDGLQQYEVGFRIDGRLHVSVMAKSLEEASRLAADKYYDADLGALEDVEGEMVNICTPEGDFLYEK